MIHKMKLRKEPFEKIKNNIKTIELRLYDEKRQQIKVGDIIEFSLIDDPEEKIQKKVTALHIFENFQKLYAEIPKKKLGYEENEYPDPNHMNEYYSDEEQKKYSVVGIEIK